MRKRVNMKKAEAAFRKAVAIDPKFSQGFNNLGNSLRELGRLEDARKSYLKGCVVEPAIRPRVWQSGRRFERDGKIPPSDPSF